MEAVALVPEAMHPNNRTLNPDLLSKMHIYWRAANYHEQAIQLKEISWIAALVGTR